MSQQAMLSAGTPIQVVADGTFHGFSGIVLNVHPLTLRLFIPGTDMSSEIGPWDVDEIVIVGSEQELEQAK
jgi:hypothetical protein